MTDQPPTPNQPATSPDPKAPLERLLTDALATHPPSRQALERLRAEVEREWRSATAPRILEPEYPNRVWQRRLALAAAAVLAAVAVALWAVWPLGNGIAIGSISRLDDGTAVVHTGLFRQHRPRNGEALRVGDRLTTTGPVLVNLSRGGTLRVAADSSVEVAAATRVSLDRGLIYIDVPPGFGNSPPLRILTHAGAIEHVGTAFEIKSDGQTVRVRVREGRIRFLAGGATVLADAGTELLAAPGKALSERSIDVYGSEWLWTAALAPDYEIEGMPLIGFLQWVSRELGRSLEFADVNARQIADRTILHGSVIHQPPFEAMSNVLATTSLTYEIRGATIWVHSSKAAVL